MALSLLPPLLQCTTIDAVGLSSPRRLGSSGKGMTVDR